MQKFANACAQHRGSKHDCFSVGIFFFFLQNFGVRSLHESIRYFMRLVDVNVMHKKRKERTVMANQKSHDIFQMTSVAVVKIDKLQDLRM